jgi:uncharacterized membrane protein YhaH (DUF805 family)
VAARIGLWEHFRTLASFKGREDRASFWPYAALVLGIVMIASAVMTIPIMAHSMRAMHNFHVQNPGDFNFAVDPDEFNFAADPDNYSLSVPPQAAALMPSAGSLSAYLAVTLGLAVLLYAAAVAPPASRSRPVRRLGPDAAALHRLFGGPDASAVRSDGPRRAAE